MRATPWPDGGVYSDESGPVLCAEGRVHSAERGLPRRGTLPERGGLSIADLLWVVSQPRQFIFAGARRRGILSPDHEFCINKVLDCSFESLWRVAPAKFVFHRLETDF